MKPLRLAVLSFAAVSLLSAATSCSSDSNPFDLVVKPQAQTQTTKILLNLDVASTRAGSSDLSTEEERKVSTVSIYVFDEDDKLEMSETNINITSVAEVSLEVKPGKKTIYAVSAKTIGELPVANGTSMEAFENTIFPSKLSDLKNSAKEFVMVGKSNSQQVYRSTATDLPASNIFNIELVRLIAKAQVKLGDIKTEEFGFTHGNAMFWVSQTCDKMRLKPNEADVFDVFNNHNQGTFTGFTAVPDDNGTGVVAGNFTANNCQYLSENIVKEPKAGNTTFVILGIKLTPINNYSYDQYNKILTSSPTTGDVYSYYAVGLVNAENGYEDFAVDPENHHVITFTNKNNADEYVKSLNGGTVSVSTVSEYDSPMKASVTEGSDINVRQFETIPFSQDVYYRINISGEDGKYMVERNKYYKITVNSIKSLGCHSKEMLRPTNPSAEFNKSTSAMIQAAFKVAEWDEAGQNVDLE